MMAYIVHILVRLQWLLSHLPPHPTNLECYPTYHPTPPYQPGGYPTYHPTLPTWSPDDDSLPFCKEGEVDQQPQPHGAWLLLLKRRHPLILWKHLRETENKIGLGKAMVRKFMKTRSNHRVLLRIPTQEGVLE